MATAAQPKPEPAAMAGGETAQRRAEAAAAESWARVEALPCQLSIEVGVPGFTVGDLVSLAAGRLVDTRWTVGADVPLLVNGQLVAWSEFEIVNDHIAVRLTELA